MAELNVSKKSLSQIFDKQGYRYVIPQYQRPYSWDIEKCEVLWNDILDFFQDVKNDPYSQRSYYFGCIVTTDNGAREISLVDGQQRITSLMLLLRAIYQKISSMDRTDEVNGQMSQIERCLWDLDPVTQKVANKSSIRLQTYAALQGGDTPLMSILEHGVPLANDKSNYTKNFDYFGRQYDAFIQGEPQYWKRLVHVILNNCVLIPIECSGIDEALRIFNTLNDRGMPLSDADIFKSYLYGYYSEANRSAEFIDLWNELNSISLEAGLKVDDVFRYYAYKIRCEHIAGVNAGHIPDADSLKDVGREIDLRRFYLDSHNNYLATQGLMQDLIDLAKFWKSISDTADDYDQTYLNPSTKRLMHCLLLYPNINWRRVVSVFFFAHNKNADEIRRCFYDFAARLLSFLCVKYINKPGVDSIRSGVAKACVEMMSAKKITDSCKEHILPQQFVAKFDPNMFAADKLMKTLIVLNAYLVDEEGDAIIPDNFHVEHILPKKWQDANYQGWDYNSAIEGGLLECIGNKIPFEKTLNIQAGNGYFAQKKVKYAQSSILEVQQLSLLNKCDWSQHDVHKRLDKVSERLTAFFAAHLN